MTTFYVYRVDSLEFLGAVEAMDREVARQLAAAVWPEGLKVLDWRLRLTEHVAA
jgi:hypothetical protein